MVSRRAQQNKTTQYDPLLHSHLHIDNLVAYQGLQEDTDQAHKSILHVLVLDVLTGGNAVGNVEVDELGGQVHRRGRQPVHHLHRVQRHVHVDKRRQVPEGQVSSMVVQGARQVVREVERRGRHKQPQHNHTSAKVLFYYSVN